MHNPRFKFKPLHAKIFDSKHTHPKFIYPKFYSLHPNMLRTVSPKYKYPRSMSTWCINPQTHNCKSQPFNPQILNPKSPNAQTQYAQNHSSCKTVSQFTVAGVNKLESASRPRLEY